MKYEYTICWDCAKATGGCEWSDRGEPVEGWSATFLKASGTKPFNTYHIYSCPKFERDSYGGGLLREKKEIKLR